MELVSAKREMQELSEKGITHVSLNGWTESVGYVAQLGAIKKIEEGSYESE